MLLVSGSVDICNLLWHGKIFVVCSGMVKKSGCAERGM